MLQSQLQLLQDSLMLQIPVQPNLLHVQLPELLRLQPLRHLQAMLLMPQRLQAKLWLFQRAMLQILLMLLYSVHQLLQVVQPVVRVLLLQAVLQMPVLLLQRGAVLLQVPVVVL